MELKSVLLSKISILSICRILDEVYAFSDLFFLHNPLFYSGNAMRLKAQCEGYEKPATFFSDPVEGWNDVDTMKAELKNNAPLSS